METSEKRFYVIVPKTVQVERKERVQFGFNDWRNILVKDTVPMEAGRLMAQAFHVARKIDLYRYKATNKYEEITTIVLSVRNSAELKKVTTELFNLSLGKQTGVDVFCDTNPEFYGTLERVHTVSAIGPVTKEEVEEAIGHLELYS